MWIGTYEDLNIAFWHLIIPSRLEIGNPTRKSATDMDLPYT